MTPQEALQVLDQATSIAPLNRQQHQQTIEALKTLEAAVTPQQGTPGDKSKPTDSSK